MPRRTRRALRATFVIGVVLVLPIAADAERLPSTAFTSADGLGHDHVRCAVRDSGGLLWFCTADGLARFDGAVFTRYGPADGLPSARIHDLVEDAAAGTLWVATDSGLYTLDAATDEPSAPPRFQRAAGGPADGAVNDLLLDSRGRLWTVGAHELFRVDRDGSRPVALDTPRAELLTALEDRAGGLWLGGRGGLERRAEDGGLEPVPLPDTAGAVRAPTCRSWTSRRDRTIASWRAKRWRSRPSVRPASCCSAWHLPAWRLHYFHPERRDVLIWKEPTTNLMEVIMSRKKFSVLRNPKAAALAAVLLLATVQAAFAQRVQVYEGKLDGVWISVERLSTGQHMKLRPGSTLELEPGEQVLLRPFSPKDENPTGDRQYLSAEFSLTKGGENIEVVKHEPPYGRIFIEPRQNAGGKTATLHYRLLGKVQATRAGLASGTLTIEIARDARRSAPGRAGIYEGKVDEVRISVRRLDDDNERTQLRPGETLRLDPGEQVLLRPFSPRDGNPTGDRQYLSAEFTLERKGSVNIDVLESEHHYGRVVIEARRGGAGKAAALRYRLLDVNVARAGLTEDVIPIEIAGVAGVAPPVAPDAPRRGVTLYEDNNYRGENETFFEDRPDLRNSRIRNDRVSSIRIPEGCTVTLYRDVSYQGRISVLRSDVPELGRTEVGNDSVSSLKVDCR